MSFFNKVNEFFQPPDIGLDKTKKEAEKQLETLKKSGDFMLLAANIYPPIEKKFIEGDVKKDMGVKNPEKIEMAKNTLREGWDKEMTPVKLREIALGHASMDDFITRIENRPPLKDLAEEAMKKSEESGGITNILDRYFPDSTKSIIISLGAFLGWGKIAKGKDPSIWNKLYLAIKGSVDPAEENQQATSAEQATQTAELTDEQSTKMTERLSKIGITATTEEIKTAKLTEAIVSDAEKTDGKLGKFKEELKKHFGRDPEGITYGIPDLVAINKLEEDQMIKVLAAITKIDKTNEKEKIRNFLDDIGKITTEDSAMTAFNKKYPSSEIPTATA